MAFKGSKSKLAVRIEMVGAENMLEGIYLMVVCCECNAFICREFINGVGKKFDNVLCEQTFAKYRWITGRKVIQRP